MTRNHKLSEKYNPKEFEDELYKNWEEKKYFKPSMDKTKESYCISMPPPNVTGKLHMGHALDDSMQDILIRYKRMCGYNTLWVPGTDHSAIATEVKVVEKIKKEEGLTKYDLGREKFLERAWEWTHEYGGTIQRQQRKLGCSCDWERSRFTLDEGLSNAVLEQFEKLYNKGLIYKGKRMINWCPDCKSTISDIEVEYEEETSHLWHLRYKIVNENNEETTSGILDEIIYPLYVPVNTHLSTEDTINTDSGNRAILTFQGDSPFVLIEEVSKSFDDFEIIPVNGEPLMIADTIGALSNNSLYWTSNGIDYYLSSTSLDSNELVTIAEGLTGTSVIVSSEK